MCLIMARPLQEFTQFMWCMQTERHVVCLCRWLKDMNAAVKKQRVLPVSEIISDAMLDVTDSGSTLDHIEQYVIVCCFRMKFGSAGS